MQIQFRQGDVISYMEMCQAVGVSLQRGMNSRIRGIESVILMSRRKGAKELLMTTVWTAMGRFLSTKGTTVLGLSIVPTRKNLINRRVSPAAG